MSNWIAARLAAWIDDVRKNNDYNTVELRSLNQIYRLLVKLGIARQERDHARAKLSEAETCWRADIDSYNMLFHDSGAHSLFEKVRNLEHEIMGLAIAYRELADARETIAALTQERDDALSRLGAIRLGVMEE